ncbi:ATP-dependent RNA helicase HrpA [Lignipirellula cremea]|uniref:ATP-dependent RNA helicase HrpB n=1 Tax=Lignipirellula cremea TaxID=2528010 RepID=A0A518DP34_9BACT|nr:ATP-dependent RNA helicase HrpA [Lignipirellula cremea]QDU93595.1 ATP-dependent RNA helicase HrpB [Lignipirellula cremea]
MMSQLSELESQLAQTLLADRYRLRRKLRGIAQAIEQGKPFDRSLTRAAEEIHRSIEIREKRRQQAPTVTLEESLPVSARAAEISAAIAENQVVVVCGETGSGKSTQLPKICLQLGRGIEGMIGHTQPRRIAARSIAARLAEELQSPLGKDVGFKVRFTDTTRPETYVKLMTDGVLLAETQSDRFLNLYDTIILDEAHERSLNIDFLLGYFKGLLPKRRDLRLIITSATIDAERFAEHFADERGPAPVIEVSGRAYPVELRYRPLLNEDDPDLQQAVCEAVREAAAIDTGDILIFLPTEREIRETTAALRKIHIPGDNGRRTEILPLYARLSNQEQNKVFRPHSYRRIVLATNVAESSLTVPGIRFVIDTGVARISRYSPRSKVQRLPIEAVSKASADQRKGRCGRVGPGICFRLYTEEDYLGRDPYTTPEIRRTNLASVILQTTALKLGAIEQFPFLDPPKPEHIRDGYKTLYEIGAIDEDRELTDLGRQLSRLPVDPRIGRMILAAHDEHCLGEMLIIASALELQDPRERPVEKREAADEMHARHVDEKSDFMSILKLWDFYHQLRSDLSRNQLRKACQKNFLSANRLREWTDVHRQLRELADQTGLLMSPRKNDYLAIHRALLTGLLSGVAFKSDAHEYTGAGGVKFHLWPGSGPFKKKPQWIVAAEVVETTRRYGRTIAAIEPEWIEPLAQHLVKCSYSEPHWSKKNSAVMCYEKVSLMGLPIVPKRRVRYGPIDPEYARELFLQHGLVEGDMPLRAPFLEHNAELLEQVKSLGAKTRSREFIVDDRAIYRFYDGVLPEEVYDGQKLHKWRKLAEAENPRVLFMTESDLLEEEPVEMADEAFPDKLDVGPMALPLEYLYQPGDEADGVTLTTPLAGLNQLDADRLGWLVPGLLKEKVIALIRSLPKQIRRNLVPAPEVAQQAISRLTYGEGPFLPAVAKVLSQLAEEPIPLDKFRLEKLPDHLQMNVRIVDEGGAALAAGRDLHQLRSALSQEATESVAELDDSAWRRDDITTWDFDDLPAQVEIPRGAIRVPAYPALVDQGNNVALRLFDSRAAAERATRGGIRRLYIRSEKKALRAHVAWLPSLPQMKLFAGPLGGAAQLEQQLAELIADRAFLGDRPLPRTREQFQQQLKSGRDQVQLAVQDILRVTSDLFAQYHQARLAVEEASSKNGFAIHDARRQLKALTAGEFLTDTPWRWLQHLPRYLQAIVVRFDKLKQGGGPRDRASYDELAPWLEMYEQRRERLDEANLDDPELTEFRWMLEEFRVSQFAQQLGTSVTISAKRLEKQWAKTTSPP